MLEHLVAGTDVSGRSAFSVSHRGDDGSWLELLADGLTFDCRGLAPGNGMELPGPGPTVGMASFPGGEVVDLVPGPHLAQSAGLVPVLRVVAGLGAKLATLPGVRAVIWTPAGSWVEPSIYIRAVEDWLAGGAFPALALTALERLENGAIVSRGLGLIVGQELRLEPDHRVSAADLARIAVRLIHDLVLHGAVRQDSEFFGPADEQLLAVPVRGGGELRVMLRTGSS